jgi:hypothetical protein
MNDVPTSTGEFDEPTEQELIDEFVTWVEMMVHDIESVPDDPNTRYWCPRWWDHPEAVTRLRALHQEYIRAEGENALSSWYIYHWDGHAKTLFASTGPFERCRTTHSFYDRAEKYIPRLVTEAVPENWEP